MSAGTSGATLSSGTIFGSNDAATGMSTTASGSSTEDAGSSLASVDAATAGSTGQDAAVRKLVDAASAPDTSSGATSGTDAGTTGSAVCPNALGTVWKETDVGGQCTSTWTRQGTTSMFTDAQAAPCKGTGTLNIVVDSGNVSAYFTSSNNGSDCDYIGTMSADCSSASGVFSCTSGGGQWSATIQH
jgi:hypothetical protein